MVAPHALVVTSCSLEGWEIYGIRWSRTYMEHWHPTWGKLIDMDMRFDDQILEDPEVRAFREREADAQTTSSSLRHGVMKWSWKVFALTMDPMPTSGWMIWIDGDVEFIATPDQAFFDAVCPEGADVSFLARPWANFSECGFVAYNMSSQRTRDLLGDMRRMYLYGTFRALESWNDCAVFDTCRAMQRGELIENDLCAHLDESAGLHVWPQPVLAPYLKHNKGPKRKTEAYGGTV